MSLDRAGLRVLTRAECLHRLSSVRIGRVALSWKAMPVILPVHYVVDDDAVVFSARAGTTLHRCTDDAVVALEAEGPPGAVEPVWTVVVQGVAKHGTPWPTSASPQADRIEVRISEVSGRKSSIRRVPWRPWRSKRCSGGDSAALISGDR